MSSGSEKTSTKLRTKLAVAVKSIQWSYGIFWASSSTKQRTLEWNEGYYNGEIKTRKTVQSMMELKADKIRFQRSEQLRELYQFLLVGETDSQAKRPSAALSPEDLTDLEWYYLVCMSFMFNHSQSLPGRALEKGETIWLCNAQYADSKVFSRSLLAKSASIQTVVCFPYLGGVIEIGTTELVPEDPNLIQHVKTCFLEFSKPICSEKPSSPFNKEDEDKYPTCANINAWTSNDYDTTTLENRCSPTKELQDNNEEFNMDSSEECCNGCDHHCQVEGSMFECISGAQDSLSSGDCISEALEKQAKEATNADQGQLRLTELHDCNHSKLSSLGIGIVEDVHYTRTLSALLGNAMMFKGHSHARNSNWRSSFAPWNNGRAAERARQQLDQSMLKKILFTVPLMHNRFFSSRSPKQRDRTEFHRKLDIDDHCVGKSLSDERRESENYQVDKISILNDTIKYMKELEAKVEELESCTDIADSETTMRSSEVMEQTSDNCDIRRVFKARKPQTNKRKACNIDESGSDLNSIIIKEGKSWDVKVDIKEKEVVIEMKCPYREFILLEIMDAISNVHLEAHTVQSSTVDGFLVLTLKSKFRGAAIAPTRMIYETLWKVCDKT
ncbi:transcription factor EGL1 isoform X2 [Neltuma alba]|uniref:transcription factor EGL1 isoform X2 n=1 Tax=Neltuma alba TaxID=207710 RepID=UPI0010A57008|nr:transcription factor EGL1-like isoform X2 [Prosopis alba]